MKVQRVIELLNQQYSPDTEIMINWWGSECFETKAGVWDRAVELFDSQETPQDYSDYVRDLVSDAEYQIEIFQESAIDAYLEREAEKKAGLL